MLFLFMFVVQLKTSNMKKLLLTLIVCAFTSIASFAQTDAQIIGTWKYDGVPNASETGSAIVEVYDNSLKDLNIEFSPDHKFTVIIGSSKVSGTWKIADGKVEFKYKDSKVEKIEIVKFERDKLTIKQGEMVYNISKQTS